MRLPPAFKKSILEFSDDFQAFWAIYPENRKENKERAFDAFKNASDKPAIEELIEILIYQKKSSAWQEENGRFIPLPENYLLKQRWKNHPQKMLEYEDLNTTDICYSTTAKVKN